MEELGLYLHIPFCVKKCRYCDFLSFPASEESKKLYAAALIREIRGYREAARRYLVTSIFVGGGTPSVMPSQNLREIFRAVYESFEISADAEITMEMNPGTVNAGLLAFAAEHLNRVSLGVQSAVDTEAAYLGRIHRFEEVKETVEHLRKAGIRNINLDLMSGIPGQTVQSWEDSLRSVLELAPEHISAYSLIVEDGTPFGKLAEEGRLELPGEEEEREMYHLTGQLLSEYGYEHYEISNYARPGRRCRHNMRYWTGGSYLGFGLGASSFFENARWHNTEEFSEYLQHSFEPQSIVRELAHLDSKSRIEEFMFLGLRTSDGVTESAFRENFGMEMPELYGDILRRYLREGFLSEPDEGRYVLTERGVDVSSIVLADFLL